MLSDWTKELIRKMNSLSLLPRHVEISNIGSVYVVGSYFGDPSPIISQDVFMGMDTCADFAVQKCLSEFVERQVLNVWLHQERPDFFCYSTDGCAALPLISNKYNNSEIDSFYLQFMKKRVRHIAYCEAIERFAWAYWWDHPTGSAQVRKINGDERKKLFNINGIRDLFFLIESKTPIKNLWRIQPYINNSFHNQDICEKENDIGVEIFFAELKGKGFISGGAAGLKNLEVKHQTIFRALSELCRHSLALERIARLEIDLSFILSSHSFSFYEKRLAYFGLGYGDRLVQEKLQDSLDPIKREIYLPPLLIDFSLSHSFESDFVVHRCLFENQPIFLGDDIERLCL